MEILNILISIYCFISFILGAVFTLIILCITAMGKIKEPMNNVHFYVARDKNSDLYLYMGKPIRGLKEFLTCHYGKPIKSSKYFSKYGLNENDYDNLKWEDEPIEVFINMED